MASEISSTSFYNLQILPILLKDENLSNLVAILGGIDIVLGRWMVDEYMATVSWASDFVIALSWDLLPMLF